MTTQSNAQADGLVKRLWTGQVSLPKTYWLAGVLVNLVLSVIMFGVIGATEGDPAAVIASFGVVMLYQIFIFVAIWRSAGFYQGPKVWAILARVAIVLGMISNAVQFSSMIIAMNEGGYDPIASYSDYDDDEYGALRADIEAAKGEVPMVIGEDMTWDDITYEDTPYGPTVTYYYSFDHIEGLTPDLYDGENGRALCDMFDLGANLVVLIFTDPETGRSVDYNVTNDVCLY